MSITTVITYSDIDEYRAWTNRHASPAYMRGIPTWVWRQSTRGRRRHRQDGT
jgi:hypothetical protein